MSGLEIAEAYLDSLLKSERATPEELEAYQARLLSRLVKHALEQVPFYAAREAPPDVLTAGTPYWRRQPTVSRKDITENFAAFTPRSFSQTHGAVTRLSTGGSTGPAARRDTTSLEAAARLLASYRMYHSWGLDQSLPLFVFRKLRPNQPERETWGFPWRDEAMRGERRWIDIATPAREQLAQMAGLGPVYVNTQPSNILRLAHEALRSGSNVEIPFIISVGEYLAPEVREAASRAFGSTIIDAFSSAEGGVMAVQCPGSGLYHVQSEQVVVEIPRPDGEPCGPGETGEAVVTPLYGYATTLLRYRSGDFVVAGPACGCGRVLPTISAIAGRREHMFVLPGQPPALPRIDRFSITSVLEHDEWLLAQVAEREVELRHTGSLTQAQRETLGACVGHALGDEIRLLFSKVEALPLTSGGKRHFTLNARAGR